MPTPIRGLLWLDPLLDLLGHVLAPARCAACDVQVRRVAVFCPACASTAQRAPAQAEPLAAFVYGGAVAQAIVRFKYEARPDLARPLGDLLWSAVSPHAPALRTAVVVPVPLHPSRLAERGYNQAALLARRVAHLSGAPFRPLTLARTRDTPRQATLDRTARMANVRLAFQVRTPRAVAGRIVLLIDDVHTTGSTLGAAADALRAAGAVEVRCAVLACAE
jgi:ComF family protein